MAREADSRFMPQSRAGCKIAGVNSAEWLGPDGRPLFGSYPRPVSDVPTQSLVRTAANHTEARRFMHSVGGDLNLTET